MTITLAGYARNIHRDDDPVGCDFLDLKGLNFLG